MKIDCIICGKNNLNKNTIGINKKLLGEDMENFYCMDCLAEYLGCTVEELLDKIEEFKGVKNLIAGHHRHQVFRLA